MKIFLCCLSLLLLGCMSDTSQKSNFSDHDILIDGVRGIAIRKDTKEYLQVLPLNDSITLRDAGRLISILDKNGDELGTLQILDQDGGDEVLLEHINGTSETLALQGLALDDWFDIGTIVKVRKIK